MIDLSKTIVEAVFEAAREDKNPASVWAKAGISVDGVTCEGHIEGGAAKAIIATSSILTGIVEEYQRNYGKFETEEKAREVFEAVSNAITEVALKIYFDDAESEDD